MRLGFVGGSYTSRSTAIADEECLNWFAETLESQGSIAPARAYGGALAQAMRSYYGTPGIRVFSNFGNPNQLNNPNFDDDGTTGWALAAGWGLSTGVRPDGSTGNIATWTGPGTGGIINTNPINCTPGTVISARCWAKGDSGATGNSVLRIDFYNASTYISSVFTAFTATGDWENGTVTGTAPAGTTAAVIDFIVQTSTDATHWYTWGFQGGLPPIVSSVRGSINANGKVFIVAGQNLFELKPDGTYNTTADILADDGGPAIMVYSQIEVFIVSGGHAYVLNWNDYTFTEVTDQLAGIPNDAEYVDGYFVVSFQDSNKFQMSDILNGTVWPGLYVNEVSVFPGNIVGIIANHRELWVFGRWHAQPYQNTGSDNIFDVIPGCLIESGCAATNAPCRLDNSVFWVDQNERGARSCWRSQGYTPMRISTHAVEVDLDSYPFANFNAMVSWAYQDGGHQFWVLYIPGSPWSWVYDVAEQMWHKRAKWYNGQFFAHWGWNHVSAFLGGEHLIGDWDSGNLYQMSMDFLDDAGAPIRRVRRTATIGEEMQWLEHAELTVDFDTGQGLQPPLTDGLGLPRPPQAMLRWSDDRGKIWSNEHVVNCGFAGEYRTRAIWRRLGRSRYRVYELSVSDPAPWAIVDSYLRLRTQ